MIRLCAILLLASLIAGCGADGMPLRPEPGEKVAEPRSDASDASDAEPKEIEAAEPPAQMSADETAPATLPAS